MSYLSNPNAKNNNTVASAVYTTGATLNTASSIRVNSGNLSAISTNVGGTWNTIGSSVRPAPTQAPPNWTTVKVRTNHQLDTQDVYEPPVTGRTAFIGSLCISNQNGMHHWKLFARLNPDIEYLLCGIPDHEDSRSATLSNVMFFNEQDFRTFEEWFADYCDMFGGKENIYSFRLPPPPKVMGYSVQVMMGKHDDLTELAEWIISNCNDKVYYLGEMLFFLNDEDATLYKMRFTGN